MIEVRSLVKRYGGVTALDDVSFCVDTGTICGLLGPNGAGKSTTMNIMTGCLAATSGSVFFDGQEIYANRDSVKRSIGYLPETPPVYPELTVREYLTFVGQAKKLSPLRLAEDIEELSEACGIDGVLDRLIRNLSKGYKQRIGIAQALMGDPRTVILDEPTVGLDPLQIVEIRSLIARIGQGRTVLISSHILSEIQAMCDQIVIISKGHVVADDTPDKLERLISGTQTTRLVVRAEEGRAREAIATLPRFEALTALPHVESIEVLPAEDEENALSIILTASAGEDIREQVFRTCARANLPVLEMSTKRKTLEDVFVELVGDSGTDNAPGDLHHSVTSKHPAPDTPDVEGGDAPITRAEQADSDPDVEGGDAQ